MDELDTKITKLLSPVSEKTIAAFTLRFAGVIVIDELQKIVYASETADHLFNYPLGGLKGRQIEEIVPEDGRVDHRRYVAMFFAGAMVQGHSMGAGIPRKIMGQPMNGTPFPIVVTLNRFAEEKVNYAHALIQKVAEDLKSV